MEITNFHEKRLQTNDNKDDSRSWKQPRGKD